MDAQERTKAMRDALASEIRARRAYRRMTQAELIAATGLSRSTVGRIESAERDMDVPQLVQIAAALGTTPAELLQSAMNALRADA